ncbi:MAG: c-type cytochrome [Gammaproteobacteria bacterium]
MLAMIAGFYVPCTSAADSNDAAASYLPIEPSPYTDKPADNADAQAEGRLIFERGCALCHGMDGKGDGPTAYFIGRSSGPRPRDFTSGTFKFRSTESGELPTDEDLFRTVSEGIPGFMPAYGGLSVVNRWKVIYYIKTFYPGFKDAKPAVIKVVGQPAMPTVASIDHGHQLYQRMHCWECHGGGGEGDGSKAPTLKDDWGMPLPPANLTLPQSFKNGHRPVDIYMTIMTGLNGTPMPSYSDLFQGHEQDAWDLTNYILSLSADGSGKQKDY